MNEEAIQKIAENLKNVVDGGSDDLKKALDEFKKKSEEISTMERDL